jgi:predicted DNA binding CopG/RHH family protein
LKDTSINIRIPTEELEAAKFAAERQGYTKFAEWVREAMRRML